MKIVELTSELDRSKSLTHQLVQEKDNLAKSLESIRTERTALENNKKELNAMACHFNNLYYSNYLLLYLMNNAK